MDWKKIIFICAVLVVISFMSPTVAAPSYATTDVSLFTPWIEENGYAVKALPVTGFVSDGGTKSYSYFIPSSAERLEISLNWNRGVSDNSLSLRMYDASTVYGPFYDSYDGMVNGVIPLVSTSFNKGCTWTFEVYGDDVSGIQMFSLTVNAI